MTGTLKVKVNGEWLPIAGSGQDAANVARWNSAWGVVASASRTDAVNVTVNGTAVLSANFTAVAGRAYSAQFWAVGQYNQALNVVHNVLKLDDGTVIKAEQRYTTGTVNEQLTHNVEIANFTTTAGVHNVYLEANYTGAGGVMFQGNWSPMRLVVTDVGPVTPASIAPPTAGPRVVASGNALGIVAMGALNGGAPQNIAANTWATIGYDLSCYTAVGRRYRVAFVARALNAPAAQTVTYVVTRDGVRTGERLANYSGPYLHLGDDWLFDGDGATHVFNISVHGSANGASVYTDSPQVGANQFYVEDVGPSTSPALPIPETAPVWTTAALLNGWTAASTPVKYRKLGDVVSIRGEINAGTINQPAFTVPVAFRPPVLIGNPTSCWGGAGTIFARGYVNEYGSYHVTDGTNNAHWINLSYATTP